METLRQEDLRIGDYVTVLQGRRYKPYGGYAPCGPSLFTIIETEMTEDQSGKGELFRVLAIDLPYVIAERLSGLFWTARNAGHCTWDLRDVRLKKLSRQFVNAALRARDDKAKHDKGAMV